VSAGPRIELQPMSSVRRMAIRWLPGYRGYIPLGMLTLLAGRQGLGKSLYGHMLAAELTRAGSTVLLASAEEPASEMIRPRLEAAGANLDHVHRMTLAGSAGGAGLKLPGHAPELRDVILDAGPRLVILDPVGAYVGGNIDSWKDDSVRQVLTPLAAIAEEAGCAFLLVGHLNKGTGDYLARVMGSTAWTAAVRSALLFSDDPDAPDEGRRLLSLGKTNISPHGTPGRLYAIEEVRLPADGQHEEVDAPRLNLVGDSQVSATEALGGSTVKPSEKIEAAIDYLLAMLKDGPVARDELLLLGDAAGHKRWALDRASDELKVVKRRSGMPARSHWSLPLLDQSATDGNG
jgi:putative DNA primase/helicase